MIPPLRSVASLIFVLLLAGAAPLAAQTTDKAADEPLLIVKDGRYGYIDHNGHMVIQPQYLWAGDFVAGMAKVFLCGRVVFIDRQGDVWPRRPFSGAPLRPLSSRGKTGFVDAAGEWVIRPRYEDALPFSEGLAAVKEDGKWGFVDTEGKAVLDGLFDEAYYFNQGVALVTVGEEHQLIDKSGRVLARSLGRTGLPAEGLIATGGKTGKWGYLTLDGSPAISPQFDYAGDFSENLAVVIRDGKAGYIDHTGAVVIPIQFDWAYDFSMGLAPVRQGPRSGFINRSGEFAFELSFRDATQFLFGDAARFWTKDDQFGYVLTSGKVIWGPAPESPDHWPLFGWSDEDIHKTCEGVPDLLRQRIASFPPIPRD